ncbi:hypothetical protein AMST5_03904 [freshwater sediment metagenome]|uniref:Uncharacterized protein n=1 Tax=freshwater sediment metagenome TaxID=556182 RepID=A0AA48M2U7_9ZZZZ
MSSHASTVFAGEPDPIEQINLRFRSLYGANRDELFAQTPLAGLTLIGTGELWRIEYGRVVKSYPPTDWLPKVKGLMHAIIGAEGTWARLARGKNPDAARNAAEQLNCALREAVSRVPNELPRELAGPAEIILRELLRLSDGWSSGRETTAREFPEALARVQAEVTQVIDIVGEGVYASMTKGLREFVAESEPNLWSQSIVCVCGVAFGRRDNVEIAAAMALMGRETIGTRLLYLENAHTVEEGLKCLSAAIADRELGQNVFGDPYRMWRDILGDVASRHAGGGFFPALGPQS